MSSGEKTALWSLLFGVGVAVAALALPLAFDVPPYVWRVALCLGAIISAASATLIAYENFVKRHPSSNARRLRITTFVVCAALIVLASVFCSIFIPEPKHFVIYPRVAITQVQPIFLSQDDGIRFNIDFTNLGPRSVRGVTIHFGLGFSTGGAIPEERRNQAFADLAKLKLPDPKSADFMETGANRNNTLPGSLDEHTEVTSVKMKEIQQTKGMLFIAISISYFDDKTDDIWRTEFCEYWDYNIPQTLVNNISPHLCTAHNGITTGQMTK
jgi:hypothetical protein